MKGVKIILYIAMASYITFPTGIMFNCSGDHHKAYYTYIHTIKSIYILLYVAYGHWGECLVDIKMHLFCYQKDCTRSRSVSVHSYLTYDASRAHRRGCGDKPKK